MSTISRKPLLIHIGTHKTGSTSFQSYLKGHAEELKENGFSVVPYQDAKIAACLSVRDGLPIPGRHLFERDGRKSTEKKLRSRISEFYDDNNANTIVISCEHLSYFRTTEEVDHLLSYFEEHNEIDIFVVVREKADFLRSYEAQVKKTGHGPVHEDKSSPYYCGEDSWLIDYDGMQAPWIARANKFHKLSYETENIVTDLIVSLKLPDLSGKKEYRANVTPSQFRSIAVWALKKVRLHGVAHALYNFYRSKVS